MLMYSYKINGVEMPKGITDFKLVPTNLYGENTGRDEAGFNHLDLIRANVRKWTIKHEMLTAAEVDKIIAALDPRGFTFVGTSPSGTVAANCYANITDITMNVKTFKVDGIVRYSMQISFIEN